MYKKDRSIIACKNQAEKYREAKPGIGFGNHADCSLCKIHYIDNNSVCDCCCGCPLSDRAGEEGCVDFETYKTLSMCINSHKDNFNTTPTFPEKPTKKLLIAYESRAKFYDWLAIELEDYPASQFTKKGWLDFKIDKNL